MYRIWVSRLHRKYWGGGGMCFPNCRGVSLGSEKRSVISVDIDGDCSCINAVPRRVSQVISLYLQLQTKIFYWIYAKNLRWNNYISNKVRFWRTSGPK